LAVDNVNFKIDRRQARASFDRAAPGYDRAAVLQHEVESRLFERLEFVRLKPATILDLGCGTGGASAALLSRYGRARVVACDIALSMLVRTRTRGRWLRRPLCVGGDAESLPFADGRFDLVFSNLMLQWCDDPDRVFREIRRILAPGGLLMFTTFGPDTLRELRSSWATVDGYTHVNAFMDMHDVGDALVRCGLTEPVMDVERLTLTYKDARGLMRDLKAIGAHNVTRGRPRGLTGRHKLDRFVAAYEQFRRPDGLLPASYEVVNGHAWAPDNRVSIPVERLKKS